MFRQNMLQMKQSLYLECANDHFADHGFHQFCRGDRAERGGARSIDRLSLA